MKPDKSLRWCGLLLTGAGLLLALALGWWLDHYPIPDGTLDFYAEAFSWSGWVLVAGGLLLLVIDAMLRILALRHQERTRKPAKSLRWSALMLTGIGVAVALPTYLMIPILDRYYYSAELIIPGAIVYSGVFLAVGGLITLIVDGMVRLTGRRF